MKEYKYASKTKNPFLVAFIYLTSLIMLVFLIFGNVYIGIIVLCIYIYVFIKSPSKVYFYEEEIRLKYVVFEKKITYRKLTKIKFYSRGIYSGSSFSMISGTKQYSFDYGTTQNLCDILNFLHKKGIKIITNEDLREIVNVDFQNEKVFSLK